MINLKNQSVVLEGDSMKTGAVVVAAGLSSRMKSFKPMLQLAGSTIIKTVVSTLRSAGVSTVVVVVGKNADKMIEHLSEPYVVCVYNKDYAQTDMFYSACIGLRFIQHKTDRLFFLPGDVPLFSRQSLITMMGYMDSCSCSIVIPSYNGKRGHPVLMKNNVIPEIVSYKGDGGLKDAIGAYAGVKDVIELQDPGITIDADRPEDYRLLKNYAKSLGLERPVEYPVNAYVHREDNEIHEGRQPGMIPTKEQCLSMMEEYKVPYNIKEHCIAVGWVAVRLAALLNDSGHKLDVNLIEAAALLHDIARTRANHAQAAAEILYEMGYTKAADIVRQHMKPDPEEQSRISEVTIVYLADKYAAGDRIVTLKQRFTGKIDAFNKNLTAVKSAEENYRIALALQNIITKELGCDDDTLELLLKEFNDKTGGLRE
jgi:molybdenum cofactor cytidylyltransferase